MTYFRTAYESNDGGGAGFDDEPISFGEAFGINEDGSPYEADDSGEPTTVETPPADPPQGEPAVAQPGETPDEAVERLYAGKYKTVEELERGYQEANKKLSETRPAEAPQQEAPVERPSPLLKGEVSEIKTEADLFSWATADPEAAAMWAMDNHERLSEPQVNQVMDNWIASSPWKAMQEIHAWQTALMREEFSERQAIQDMHYTKTMRDQGIEMAIKEQPLLEAHSNELGQFIKANPHLNQMVEGARTAEEVKGALHAIFYMMAGPMLSQQALEAQVAARVKAEEAAARKAQREQEAAAAAAKAGTISRNTAPPPGGDETDEYTKTIQDAILNPSGRR